MVSGGKKENELRLAASAKARIQAAESRENKNPKEQSRPGTGHIKRK